MHMVYEVLDFNLHDIPSAVALTPAWLPFKETDQMRDEGE